MIFTLAAPLVKFTLRTMILSIALVILGVDAIAGDLPKLDANGQRLYKAILDSQPSIEISDDGTGFGYILERVTGHPRYEKPPNNGSIAEVIYDFKPAVGTKEFRLKFLIYPDTKSASQKLSGSSSLLSLLTSGLSVGDIATDFTIPASKFFEMGQHGEIAKSTIGDEASVSIVYQVERIIIASKTDARFPGIVIRDSDKLSHFFKNEAEPMVEHVSILLSQGKDVLDQPEIKALLH